MALYLKITQLYYYVTYTDVMFHHLLPEEGWTAEVVLVQF